MQTKILEICPTLVADKLVETYHFSGLNLQQLIELQPFFQTLPLDPYIAAGYRRRALSSFRVTSAGNFEQIADTSVFHQSKAVNPLAGDQDRVFEPIQPSLVSLTSFQSFLLWTVSKLDPCYLAAGSCVDVHQIRILASEFCRGFLAPEGKHRDGVDRLAVVVVNRYNVQGGLAQLFLTDEPNQQFFSLKMDTGVAIVLDDAKLLHYGTPIQPAKTNDVGFLDFFVIYTPSIVCK